MFVDEAAEPLMNNIPKKSWNRLSSNQIVKMRELDVQFKAEEAKIKAEGAKLERAKIQQQLLSGLSPTEIKEILLAQAQQGHFCRMNSLCHNFPKVECPPFNFSLSSPFLGQFLSYFFSFDESYSQMKKQV